MKQFILLLLIAGIAIIAISCASQKGSVNLSNTSALVEKQQYTFVARSVFPTEDARYNIRDMFPNGAGLYQLTSRYDLRVTPDSIIAYLPFFGRSYTAPVDPTQGGIKFISTNFEYKKAVKKGNFEIEITPKNDPDVRNLFLSISPNGYASLRVLCINKTPISYNGEIEAYK